MGEGGNAVSHIVRAEHIVTDCAVENGDKIH